ncbi:hypothetical protein LPH50_10195 [Xylella taiwanensis]|uniref:Transposase n=3 Tax=Xylella taiwanensis TaxID=1444770 RepID=A0ABS8TXN5_9GAMM|nr:hypothetical protein [Xylella taiwanensis]MCD8460843.1 hypothetical protein [Xylella taiwanensis]MCD8470571.1 hypothetical protein [Xylella taiwanensis]MCD8473643.1 hypothetical protein [Xylella taiwanensis]QKD98208.1 hypothetical protein PLS229_04490 [Xylella taiwanensis]UFM93458.1 hypothetical protein LPH39_10210 [Xylella taiwanensis]
MCRAMRWRQDVVNIAAMLWFRLNAPEGLPFLSGFTVTLVSTITCERFSKRFSTPG